MIFTINRHLSGIIRPSYAPIHSVYCDTLHRGETITSSASPASCHASASVEGFTGTVVPQMEGRGCGVVWVKIRHTRLRTALGKTGWSLWAMCNCADLVVVRAWTTLGWSQVPLVRIHTKRSWDVFHQTWCRRVSDTEPQRLEKHGLARSRTVDGELVSKMLTGYVRGRG